MKNVKVRHDTVKLEESIGKTFSDINCTNVFLGQSSSGNKSKWDLNKTYKFFPSKGNQPTKQKQKNLQNGRKYLQMM